MSKRGQKPRILVADDEVDIGEIIEAVAEDLGFEVTCVTDGAAVVDLVDSFKPDVITLDMRMPGADGVEIIRELGKRQCQANIVLISGMDQRTLSSVQALGRENNLLIDKILTKPMSVDAIENALTPFLQSTEQGEEAPADPSTSPNFDYGLSVLYEPEFQLKALGPETKQRLRICPQWRKDDDTVLFESNLSRWGKEMAIAHGIAGMAIGQALEAVRIWANQGFSPEIAVKLDASLLSQLKIPDILSSMADCHHVPRELLVIELDEATITSKQEPISDVLSRLLIKGFKLSVCVEAGGENVLSMIDSLPIDQLVVDMTPLTSTPNFAKDMEIEFMYSSLTSLTNRKGISACAANVNTMEQYQFAQQCNFNSTRGSQIVSPGMAQTILPLYTEGKFSEQLNPSSE